MPIEWLPEARQLHLHSGSLSDVIGVLESGALGQPHFGGRLATGRSYRHLGRAPFPGFDNRTGDPVPLVVPTPDRGDYRVPGLVVIGADGSPALDLRYVDHVVSAGKPDLPGLPSTYVESDGEADTVEIRLADEPTGLEVVVRASIFRDRPVVTRSLTLTNRGPALLRVETAMSVVLDLPDDDWHLVTMTGAWAREREPVDRPLAPGRRSTASVRGASGPDTNPVLILRRPMTDETTGEALGLALVWSGDFLGEVEVEPFRTARVRLGVNPETFTWHLEPGASFTTPEAVVVRSEAGLDDLSQTFHGLFRERLARGAWRDRPRPILLNNWEATYFDFDADRLVEIAAVARDLGIELFVLDDGWFGQRDSDDSSLGDWTVDRRKLPDGIGSLAARIRGLGLAFGLWIEPEMASPRSRLFEAHPEWVLGVPGRHRTESRNQLVLDLANPAVVDHLTEALTPVLREAAVDYVKWDMNRNLTEVWSPTLPPERQGEVRYRYLLGVYELYRRLTAAFPDTLFESCASGGGRFDPGLLAYAPQAWASDDTDAIERLRIQHGASLVYPISSIGAHVSAVPNHQVGRITPLETRAAVAVFGAFGYELDPTRLDDADRAAIREQIAWFRARREVLQLGRFHRLRSPFEGDGNETAWLAVAPGRGRAVAAWFRVRSRPMPGPSRLRLRDLDPDGRYRVTPWPPSGDAMAAADAGVRGGDELMVAGLLVDPDPREAGLRGDFVARLFDLERI